MSWCCSFAIESLLFKYLYRHFGLITKFLFSKFLDGPRMAEIFSSQRGIFEFNFFAGLFAS